VIIENNRPVLIRPARRTLIGGAGVHVQCFAHGIMALLHAVELFLLICDAGLAQEASLWKKCDAPVLYVHRLE
jgi:hypothetical protein